MLTLSYGFAGLCCLVGAYAFIGPSTNLYIGNKVISPDGFSRSYVSFLFLFFIWLAIISTNILILAELS